MINREQWAEIYDWARYNGLSPINFIVLAVEWKYGRFENISKNDEKIIYEACRQFSISRTKYPEIEVAS